MNVQRFAVLLSLAATSVLALMTSVAYADPSINLVSVSTSGEQGNGQSFLSDSTPDGRYIVFESYASNLISGDNNNGTDIFLRDTGAGTTDLISANAMGNSGNESSRTPVISEDGRYIAFMSRATDLVSQTTHGMNAFVYDRTDDTYTLVSVNNMGVPANDGTRYGATIDMTPDGRYVAFTSQAANLSKKDTTTSSDVYIRHLQQEVTHLVSVRLNGKAAGRSYAPSISADGNLVAFRSLSSHITNGDDNGVADIFVRDRSAGLSEIDSVSGTGEIADGRSTWPPSLSDSG